MIAINVIATNTHTKERKKKKKVVFRVHERLQIVADRKMNRQREEGRRLR